MILPDPAKMGSIIVIGIAEAVKNYKIVLCDLMIKIAIMIIMLDCDWSNVRVCKFRL